MAREAPPGARAQLRAARRRARGDEGGRAEAAAEGALRPRTLTLTLPSDREVRATRRFDAPPRLVFRALTTPDLLKRWLVGPDGWALAVCTIDLRVGGAYRYVWRKPSGREMGMGGVYRAIEPPARLVCTELFDDDWTGGETVVTTTLDEDRGGTLLTQTILFASQAARDGARETGFDRGMEAAYDVLADVLAEGGTR